MNEEKQEDGKTDKDKTSSSTSCEPETPLSSTGATRSDSEAAALCDMFRHSLRIPPAMLDELSLAGVARYIQREQCKNVIVMVGAGISTSAGIPDFRSPTTGIYASLDKYDLPLPECMFEIGFFKKNPAPFFKFAKEMFPSGFKPTLCHYFLRMLHEKGKLLRLYTQNIDALERVAGIPPEKIVEAHGTFYTSHCMNAECGKKYDLEWVRAKIFDDVIPKCTDCGKVVKPDIVFFGESLPTRFQSMLYEDFPLCDLLIVIGTSLTVEPFASLIDMVPRATPRVLINNKKCGQHYSLANLLGLHIGFNFDSRSNDRDVLWLGTCDDGSQKLAEALEWGDELQSLFREEHEKLDSDPSPVPVLGDIGEVLCAKKDV